MKLAGQYIGPAHRLERQNREKTQKWPENDQFRQFHFLTKRFFGSNSTSFDAELQMKFFETIFRFVGCLVLELLTKNVSKNRSTTFRPLRWSWIPKSPFSPTTWNSTKFGGQAVST